MQLDSLNWLPLCSSQRLNRRSLISLGPVAAAAVSPFHFSTSASSTDAFSARHSGNAFEPGGTRSRRVGAKAKVTAAAAHTLCVSVVDDIRRTRRPFRRGPATNLVFRVARSIAPRVAIGSRSLVGDDKLNLALDHR